MSNTDYIYGNDYAYDTLTTVNYFDRFSAADSFAGLSTIDESEYFDELCTIVPKSFAVRF